MYNHTNITVNYKAMEAVLLISYNDQWWIDQLL